MRPLLAILIGLGSASIAMGQGTAIAEVSTHVVPPLGGSISRTLPGLYQPGVAFTVQITAQPAPAIAVYTVQEIIPTGWSVAAISDSGAYDSAQHAVKWGPFFDSTPRTLEFSLTPAANADSTALFTGQGIFDNDTIITAGPNILPTRTGTALRVLPETATLPASLVLSNIVTPKPGSINWAVQDGVPTGWTVSNISDAGVFDSASRQVKWGPFFDDIARNLTCTLQTAGLPGAIQFQGTVSFDGVPKPIGGASAILLDGFPTTMNYVARDLPLTLRPGSSFVLTNFANPTDSISAQAIEEQIPAGWTVSEISDSGFFDAQNAVVKWGPFFDAVDCTLTCRLTSPLSASGTIVFTGTASFNASQITIAGDSDLTMTGSPNRPPLAAADSFVRQVNGSLSIPVATLLQNDTDPDNDALTVNALGVSLRGVMVTLVNGVISYTPAAGMNQSDSFFYTIRDGDGATATGTVAIQVAVSQTVVSLTRNASGALVKFTGTAGSAYDIQMATTLGPPTANWSTLTRKTADPNGLFEHLDPAAASTSPRFYRSLLVQ